MNSRKALAYAALTLCAILARQPAWAADWTQAGNIIIDPASPTVQLRLQGQTSDNLNTDPHGLVIESNDLFEGAAFVSTGSFTLRRPKGTFYWQYQIPGHTNPDVAMSLEETHALTLLDPSGTKNLVLTPGAAGGITLGGVPLFTGSSTIPGSYTIGSAGSPVNLTVTGGLAAAGASIWPDSNYPGTLALGPNTYAYGPSTLALGDSAAARYYAVALGDHSYAESNAFALGNHAHASNNAYAIGLRAIAGANSIAIGQDTEGVGYVSMSLLSGRAEGSFSMALEGGLARATASYACGWGAIADGTYSYAVVGGYTHGFQSFATSGGVAMADYSTASGRGTVARIRQQTVLGTYNLTDHPEAGTSGGEVAAFDPQPDDPVFAVGNGWVNPANAGDTRRSTAFSVSYQGDANIQGGLTVGGESSFEAVLPGTRATSVFKHDVSVQGVLRVPQAGDISMGAFTAGTLP